MSFLEVRGINKTFDKKEVLKNINFDLEKGQVLVILGQSGCGKTTLLRCLNFLEKAEEGIINIDGELFYDYRNPTSFVDKQNKFGLVFQNFNLFPHYKVIRNLTLAPSLKGLDKKMLEEKAMKLLASVGLLDSANLYPYQLSGGGQQRVAITRALMLDPEILCFDEPTSALDPGLSYEVLKAIKGLKDNMRTMIIVTHELDFAKGIADKIIFMSDGEICEVSEPNSFFSNPQTEKAQAFLSQGLWGK